MGPRTDLDAVEKGKNSLPCSCKKSNRGSSARGLATILTELPCIFIRTFSNEVFRNYEK
jgi:hypothetical protein